MQPPPGPGPLLASVDIAIVGAGVHGASLAYHLLQEGGGEVAVFDKGGIGAGATGRSASFVRHHYSNAICVRIVKASVRLLRELPGELGMEVDFRQHPLLLLAGPEHEGALRENVAMHRAQGVDVELRVPEDTGKIYPFLNPEGIVLAAVEQDAGYGDAYQLNAAYAAAAKRRGGKVYTETEVEAIRVRDGRVAGLHTERGDVEARTVVLAAGPWARSLAATAGVDLPVEPALLSLGVLRPPRDVRGTPMAFDMTTGTYWRPERGGTLLVGTDEETQGTWDPDALPEGVSFDFVTDVSRRLALRWPEMEEARFVRGWVGVDGATPDLHPIVGPVASPEGLYLSAGYSGHGFKFSPAVGKALAERIVHGRYEALDLTPFRLERFAEEETFRSRYPMTVVQ